tara:strand:- start:206 stop:1945 length:1740 start_codon:yes stop_codon:yes gene_type:complete
MADPKANINQTVNVELKENVKGVGKEFDLLNQKGNNFHNILTSIGTRLEGNLEVTRKIADEVNKDLDFTEKLGDAKKKISQANVKNLSIERELSKAEEEGNIERRKTLLLQKNEIKFLQSAKKLYIDEKKATVDKFARIEKGISKVPVLGNMLGSVLSPISGFVSQYFDDFTKEYDKMITEIGEDDLNDKLIGEAKSSAKKKAGKTLGKTLGLGMVVGLGKAMFNFFKATGGAQGASLAGIMFGKEFSALTKEFGNVREASAGLMFDMKLFSVFTGTSAEDMAKVLGLMAATSNLTTEQLFAQTEITTQLARQAGLHIGDIFADVAANAEFAAKFTKGTGMNIQMAALHAKKLGVSLSEVSAISSGLLDFETSIEKQMEAQVLLGRNINLDRARQLAFTGKHEEMMQEVLKQVGGEAEFNRLNVIQREALAASIGLSTDKLAALVREEKTAVAGTGKWLTGVTMIAGALGAAFGFLLAALPGGQLKLGRAIGGAAVGAIAAGSGAHLVKGMTPGFGDFVQRPGQAPTAFDPGDTVIGVKDPANLGMNTKKLEGLIERLITVEERGNDRLYNTQRDMVTS